MTGLDPCHIVRAAYWLGEEISRRQRFGQPVPTALRETLNALNRELSARGNPAPPDSATWKTTKQLAAQWGCTPRTVRNRAAAAGGQFVGGRWIFPEET